MTVQDVTPQIDYTLTGIADYPFSFEIFEAADIVVVHTALDDSVSTLVLTTDYTVTINPDRTGKITMLDLGLTGTIRVSRNVAYTQESAWVNNDPLDMIVQENAFDKLTMLIQQIREFGLDLPPGFPIGVEFPLPEPEKLVGWNATGDNLQNWPSAATFQSWVSACQTSESNASTSETNAAASAAAASASESNAATSETNASNSAAAAGGSQSAANLSAVNAAASETNAAASEAAAGVSETNAAASESAAATSETNAAASEASAEDWAINPEDTPVQGNDYSALHYAAKAAEYVDFQKAINLLENSEFLNRDRNPTSTLTGITTRAFILDRWAYRPGTSGVADLSRVVNTPANFSNFGNLVIPGYFIRITQTTGASTMPTFAQRTENLRNVMNQPITISFWAKANVAGTYSITPTLMLYYGTGGSTTQYITGSPSTHTIGTTWAKYYTTVAAQSSAGKTFGADNYWSVYLGLPASATFTIDLCALRAEIGSVAHDWTPDAPGANAVNCLRYYVHREGRFFGDVTTSWSYQNQIYWPITMCRIPPSITLATTSYTAAVFNSNTPSQLNVDETKITVQKQCIGTRAAGSYTWTVSADAEF